MSLKFINSKQSDVAFLFCSAPITIDKRAEWGPDTTNIQLGPEGAFLKLKSPTEISHLVQPNTDKSAPIGWIKGSAPGLFSKSPIWIDELILHPGETRRMKTRDGELNYEVTELSVICYNGDSTGPDLTDGWIQKLSDVKKNYDF